MLMPTATLNSVRKNYTVVGLEQQPVFLQQQKTTKVLLTFVVFF